MNTITKLLIITGIASLTAVSQAAVVLKYDFDGGQLTPTYQEPGNVGSAVTSSGGFPSSFGTDFIYGTGSSTAASEAGAVSGNDYFEVTITPNFNFNLNTMSFSTAFYEASGSANTAYTAHYFVRSSVDSFATNIAAFDEPGQTTTTPSFTNHSIDLSGPAFQDLSGPVSFRIYIWDTISSGARRSAIDSIYFSNTIPEPNTLALLMGGVCILFRFRRKFNRG